MRGNGIQVNSYSPHHKRRVSPPVGLTHQPTVMQAALAASAKKLEAGQFVGG